MISYIGDISKADAELLCKLAIKSRKILEFGCGASTQVLAQYTVGEITSLDTDPNWITRTQENLQLLKVDNTVHFEDYYSFIPFDNNYDLIFDDGADEFRLPFAFNTWANLIEGGYLLFHDTRRQKDVDNIAEFIKKYSPEIESVYINKDHSNITVIKKKKAEMYENWNETEGRKPWQSGYEPVNLEEFKALQNGSL